ncbi:hypothetical protein [Anabaena sp. AL09]|jgi:hypothetical protein|uniref:hypothetical protein n=1 Tax=Anabaena sp. AL09 TaxID=1710891 RepID=UPI0007FEA899|nr:hypothetical protein [Anabaena sp. AL09]OBQ11003.1 MAG: hypothetical protein AN490_06915 [Anabaena sp. AL09]
MKKIIYYCGFGQRYFQEAIISALSIRSVGGFDGEILVFCDKNHGSSWLDVYGYEAPKVTFVPLGEKEPKDAAAFRLKALNYIEYTEDITLLYLDTDIVCIRPIDWPKLFSICDLNLVNLYGYPDRTQDNPNMAGLVTDDKNILAQKAFCSGLLLFRPLNSISQSFDETLQRYALQQNINFCWEQPMLSYVLLKNKMANITLEKYVNELRNPAADKQEAFFNHLCGLRSEERPAQMINLLELALHKINTNFWR